MSSINESIVKLQEITQQNLEILKALNDSFFTKRNHLSVEVSGQQFKMPSFISLENTDNGVKVFVKQLNASPKIKVLVEQIFPNVEFLSVIKERMFKDLQKNELFYLD